MNRFIPKTIGLALIALLSLTGCVTLFAEPIEGQVLEKDTNKPIVGAIVVIRWKERIPMGLIDSQTVCTHVESTTTDNDGRYRLPGWKRDALRYTDTYKPGYERAGGAKGILYLKPFSGTREERLKYLSRAAVSCSDKHDVEIKLVPLYKALYEEANGIAVTKEEKIKALHRLKDIEILEMGSNKAWENFHRREQELK